MSGHSETPWRVSDAPTTRTRGIDILAGYSKAVAHVPVKRFVEDTSAADARRIVAAVNGTAGISTEALEAGVVAKLVEAGSAVLQYEGHRVYCGHGADMDKPCVCGLLQAQDTFRAALALARGEQS